MPTPVFMFALAHIKHFLPKSLHGNDRPLAEAAIACKHLSSIEHINFTYISFIPAKAGMTVLRKNTTIKT
jgi:hypothetical protein